MKTIIPPIDLAAEFREIEHEFSARARMIFQSGRYILGSEVAQFEKNFARFIGTKYAVGLANGSDALLLGLMAFDVKPGDEIITTPFTFISTATSIARLGAKPVFADIEPDTFNINPAEIEKKITQRTRGIIPVHLYGNPCRIDQICSIANRRGLFVIEDCAQAAGAEFNGKPLGSFGDFGAFSFYPTKTLGAFGDAGAITTHDQRLYERMKSLHLHGEDGKFHSYQHVLIGINSRLDEIQAAVLNVKLKHLRRWNASRRKIAGKYGELMCSVIARRPSGRRGNPRFRDCFARPPRFVTGKLAMTEHSSQITLPAETPLACHVYHQYTIRVPRGRDALLDHLRSNGISAGVYYPLPIHFQPCFKYLKHKKGDFPEAERATREVLSLPIYPQMSASQQRAVAESMQLFFS